MKRQKLFAICCALAVTTVGLTAADEPSVKSVLDKYVEAMGGKAALEKVKSRKIKTKLEMETGTSEGEIFAKAPNKMVSHVKMGPDATIEEGLDGTVAWAKTPWDGLREKKADEMAKAKRDADFHFTLHLKTIYPDLALKGTEKVGDEEAYVLESKPSATSKEKFWLSKNSGLLIRRDSEFSGPNGEVKSTVYPTDYKKVDGVNYPGKVKIKVDAGGQEFSFTLSFVEIEHNVEVDDSKFAKPSA